MARLKLGQWAAAEADCSEALVHDACFAKAYHRRGTARRKLGKDLAAAEDFEVGAALCRGTGWVRARRG
eukprot:288127-Chlamydomonas_euryale.AAC.1